MSRVQLTCHSLGYACEWALQAPDSAEAVRRVTDHLKCAHGVRELTGELRHRVEESVLPQ